MWPAMSGIETEEITIRGVQKTNLGPVDMQGEIEIFEGGVIGGAVSDEFHDALRFAELFTEGEQ